MKRRELSRTQRAALKARGIKPGKVTKTTPRGQATGGWSPFAPSTGQQDIADDVEYEAYDRARGSWFTRKAGK